MHVSLSNRGLGGYIALRYHDDRSASPRRSLRAAVTLTVDTLISLWSIVDFELDAIGAFEYSCEELTLLLLR